VEPRPESPLPPERVRQEMVQLWGRLGPYWGISPSTARVYAWLLSRPDEADGEEIADALGISRGASSMATRELLDWGLVQSDRRRGSRRVTYRPELELAQVVRNIVQTRKRREWDPILEKVRTWREGLGEEAGTDDPEEAAWLKERLGAIEGVVALIDSLAESFLKGGVIQRLALEALVGAANRRRPKQGRGRPKQGAR
jgi:DNA-binding transcriptional regulator GbsR (MarR family)